MFKKALNFALDIVTFKKSTVALKIGVILIIMSMVTIIVGFIGLTKIKEVSDIANSVYVDNNLIIDPLSEFMKSVHMIESNAFQAFQRRDNINDHNQEIVMLSKYIQDLKLQYQNLNFTLPEEMATTLEEKFDPYWTVLQSFHHQLTYGKKFDLEKYYQYYQQSIIFYNYTFNIIKELRTSGLNTFIKSKDTYKLSVIAQASFTVFGVLFAIVTGTLVSLSIIRPLSKLKESTENLTENIVESRMNSRKNIEKELVKIKSRDEIGSLAASFKLMAFKIYDLFNELQKYTKELEEKNYNLRKMDKLKDEFLANTSHELRTPINGIIGIVESLIDGAAGPINKSQIYNLSLVVTSARRLAHLINDILDFSKLKNKEIELQLKKVDLKSLISSVVFLSGPLIKNKDLALKNEVDEAEFFVKADENRLQQILFNLIGNGIKFTEKGEVVVSATQQGDFIAISVADTGIGIPAESYDSIFESFEQVDGSTARQYGGTGLGLPITKKLVELHGGEIKVESTVGEGSKFTFTLMLYQEGNAEFLGDQQVTKIGKQKDAGLEERVRYQSDYSEEKVHKDLSTDESGIKGRILIVDDEPINLQVLSNLLSLESYSVVKALSGFEALELFERGEEFDLVMLDVMMPRLSGLEVCRILREKYSLYDIPVLILTAKNQPQDILLGFTYGANDYLTKPFDRSELLARGRTLIALKHAVKEAIHSSQRFEMEKQRRVMVEMLSDVVKSLTSTLKLNEVLRILLEKSKQIIDYDQAAILIRINENQFLLTIFFENDIDKLQYNKSNYNDIIAIQEEDLIAETIKLKNTIIKEAYRFSSDLLAKLFAEESSCLGTPILFDEKIRGLIIFSKKVSSYYDAITSDLAYSLASQAGIGVENAKLFENVKELALTDALTGLKNRRFFMESLAEEFLNYQEAQEPFSVVIADIDHFKKVNDNYGHPTGDEVLKFVADKFCEILRGSDIVCRYGGEEFVIILKETSADIGAKVTEKLRLAIAESSIATEEFGEIKITASFGLTECNATVKEAEQLVQMADAGLYEAKKSGRNRVVVKGSILNW